MIFIGMSEGRPGKLRQTAHTISVNLWQAVYAPWEFCFMHTGLWTTLLMKGRRAIVHGPQLGACQQTGIPAAKIYQ
jgi:hypothetical protein